MNRKVHDMLAIFLITSLKVVLIPFYLNVYPLDWTGYLFIKNNVRIKEMILEMI